MMPRTSRRSSRPRPDRPRRTAGRRLALLALPALLLGGACAPEEPGPSFPKSPPDPVGMRKRSQERQLRRVEGGAARASSGWVGDGRYRPVSNAEYASRDDEHWQEELVASELVIGPFQDLRALLEGEAVDPRRVFTADARLTSLRPGATEASEVGLGVRRLAWTEPRALLDLEPWLAELAELHAGLRRVRYASLRLVGLAVEGDALVARVALDLNRELPTGGLQHDQAHWIGRWVRVDEAPGGAAWRCRELVAEEGGETLASDAPHFVDVTLEALGGTPLDPRLPQFPPNVHLGLALCDLDGDDDLDVAVAQPNRVLYNRGDGTFEDQSAERGIVEDKSYIGVLAADFDRDGDVDLAYGGRRRRHSLLYLQTDDGRFEPRDIEASSTNSLSTSLSAHDVDGDGWLDLFVAGYGSFSNPGPESADDADNGRSNQMLRGLPGGRFEDVTEAWGLADERDRWCFIAAFGDADMDGDVDLYAANDWGPNVLYRRTDAEGVRFRAEIEPRGRVDPGFSMSAFWADLDGDLDLDMYVSNMSSRDADRIRTLGGAHGEPARVPEVRRVMSKGNTLVLNGDGGLHEAASELGGRDAEWAWGTALFDPDCDGDLDVHVLNGFLSNGADDGRDWDLVWWRHGIRDLTEEVGAWPRHYDQYARNAVLGWSWAGFQRSVMFLNDGAARFTEAACVLGLDQKSDGRGVAMGDIDGDGDLDLVATSNSIPHLYVLRNETPVAGSFLFVDPIPSEHRSAAGTVLHATVRGPSGSRTYRRDVALGSGYLAQHELAQHFGLADATAVERLEIRWPDGATRVLEDLPVDVRIRVRQGVEGHETVPLAPREPTPAARLPEVEWDDDRGRIQLLVPTLPAFGDLAPIAVGGAEEGEPETLPLRPERGPGADARNRLIVLVRSTEPGWRDALEAAAVLARERESRRVIAIDLDPPAASGEALAAAAPPGVDVARLDRASARAVVDRMWPWTGHRGLRLPAVLDLSPKGDGKVLSQGPIRVDDWLRYLTDGPEAD